MKKYITAFVLAIALVLFLCACGVNEEQGDVEAPVTEESEASSLPVYSPAQTSSTDNTLVTDIPDGGYVDGYENADGSVNISIDLTKNGLFTGSLPTVDIKPHSFTADDAKMICSALFGEDKVYNTVDSPRMSDDDVAAFLRDYSSLRDDNVILDLFGEDDFEHNKTKIIYALDNLSALNEQYGDEIPAGECRWEYHPMEYYAPSDAVNETYSDYSKDGEDGDNRICATVNHNGVDYKIDIWKTTVNGTRADTFSCYISPETPFLSQEAAAYITRNLCLYDEPTGEQISNVTDIARGIIEKIDIGHWQIVSVDTVSGVNAQKPSYEIEIIATPAFNSLPVLNFSSLGGFKEYDDGTYAYPEMRITFSPKGDLISMNITSPVDFTAFDSEDSALISFDEAMKEAKNVLMNARQENYNYIYESKPVDILNVNINNIRLGLARVTEGNDYTLVPALSLEGNYGQACTREGYLLINLLDGSIIRNWIA